MGNSVNLNMASCSLQNTESPESQCFSSALMQYVQSEKDIKQSSALISCRSEEELKKLLYARKKACPYKKEKELLVGLFPEKLIKILISQKQLVSAIREFPLEVQDGMSFSQAQVCSGGVDTSQVNSQTMESKRCRGLYFAGELLDIDGTCGGYNLQWAWSSGAVAGKNAAKEEKN